MLLLASCSCILLLRTTHRFLPLPPCANAAHVLSRSDYLFKVRLDSACSVRVLLCDFDGRGPSRTDLHYTGMTCVCCSSF